MKETRIKKEWRSKEWVTELTFPDKLLELASNLILAAPPWTSRRLISSTKSGVSRIIAAKSSVSAETIRKVSSGVPAPPIPPPGLTPTLRRSRVAEGPEEPRESRPPPEAPTRWRWPEGAGGGSERFPPPRPPPLPPLPCLPTPPYIVGTRRRRRWRASSPLRRFFKPRSAT